MSEGWEGDRGAISNPNYTSLQKKRSNKMLIETLNHSLTWWKMEGLSQRIRVSQRETRRGLRQVIVPIHLLSPWFFRPCDLAILKSHTLVIFHLWGFAQTKLAAIVFIVVENRTYMSFTNVTCKGFNGGFNPKLTLLCWCINKGNIPVGGIKLLDWLIWSDVW